LTSDERFHSNENISKHIEEREGNSMKKEEKGTTC